MKNNYLLLVDDPQKLEVLKQNKTSNITFLLPLEGFSVGFNYYFKLDEIKEEAYIFLNRILDNKGIEEFKTLIKDLPTNIKGIVFDDLGILNVLNNNDLKIKKILFLNHFNCNYASINIFLNFVDSVVVSYDITIKEIEEILAKAKKPLVLYTFGLVSIMYSRRLLISNYNTYFQTNEAKTSILKEPITNQKFHILENEYGTVIYPKEPMNALELREKDNVLFNLINTSFINIEDIFEIIQDTTNLKNKYPYEYLSQKETRIKAKEEE